MEDEISKERERIDPKLLIIIGSAICRSNPEGLLVTKIEPIVTWLSKSYYNFVHEILDINQVKAKTYIEGVLLNTERVSIYAPEIGPPGIISRVKNAFITKEEPIYKSPLYDLVICTLMLQSSFFLPRYKNELQVLIESPIKKKILIFYGIISVREEIASMGQLGSIWKEWEHHDKVLLLTTPCSDILNPKQIKILDKLLTDTDDIYFNSLLDIQGLLQI